MQARLTAIFGMIVGLTLADAVIAAPVVPQSALPGRERERFMESPVERFMQPGQKASPPVLIEPSKKRRRRPKTGGK